MRIGVDARCFAQGKNTGVEEYTKNILSAIFAVDHENEYILFFNAWKSQDPDFSWAISHPNVSIKKYAIPNKLLNLSLLLLHYPKLDKLCGGVSIFFMPNSNFCALSRNVKLFLTVHDLSYHHCKHSFSWKRRLWHFFVNPRSLARRAEHIFTVSKATMSDLCVTYNIVPEKISVALNGATSIIGEYDRNSIELISVKEKYNLPYKFILYFGTIEPRKNIVNLIKAYDLFRETNRDAKHQLVIAGAHGWKGREIYSAVKVAQFKDDIKILVDIQENEKELIYTLSSVFVYPSFFEGFGFPPLEAITCRVPTIVSHTTSLPEVVGRNAIMINPMRPEEIATAITEVIDDKKLQNILTTNTEDHTKKFNWNNAADIFTRTIS